MTDAPSSPGCASDALDRICDVVHTPTKATNHRAAERHFMADFDAIRQIIKDARAAPQSTASVAYPTRELGFVKPGRDRPHDAPEWLWYGDVDGKPVVTFGRWPKHGAAWRYKWAEIQPTEHDHPKRPFAFAVKRAPENGADQWRLFLDEGAARAAAEQLDGEYEGLYRVEDRRSVSASLEAKYNRAWDVYVEKSMHSDRSTFDCIKAVVDAVSSEPAQAPTIGVLHDIYITMRHARTFITSREKMHPTGVELWDRLFAQIEALQPSSLSSTERE